MKQGYPQCPYSNCQEVLHEGDGPRKPCKVTGVIDLIRDRKTLTEQVVEISGRLDGVVVDYDADEYYRNGRYMGRASDYEMSDFVLRKDS